MRSVRTCLPALLLALVLEPVAHAGRGNADGDHGHAASRSLAGRWQKVRGKGPATLRIIDLGRGGVSIEGRDEHGRRTGTFFEIVDGIGAEPVIGRWDHRSVGLTFGVGTETTTAWGLTRGPKARLVRRSVREERFSTLEALLGGVPERTLRQLSVATDGDTLTLHQMRHLLHRRFGLFGPFDRLMEATPRADATSRYVRTAPREWP